MQTVLSNLILDHAPLAALVGNHAHWDEMLQGTPLPNVVMFVISGVTNYTMNGPKPPFMARVQFDCRGTSAAQARAVAEALEEKLSGGFGVFQGFDFQGCFEQSQRTGSDKDGASRWFYDSRDYNIHWAPA